jgi:lycopene cyclase CruP
MSVGMNQTIEPNQINDLLTIVFQTMNTLGDPVLKPFLQDVVQFPALLQTLAQTAFAHPRLILKIIPHVGLPTLIAWLFHFTSLAVYAALYPLGRSMSSQIKILPPTQQYDYHRWLEVLEYGSGGDYR